MIWLISGERDSGKSSRCIALFNLLYKKNNSAPFGLISRKVFSGKGVFLGYKLQIAGTETSRPLALLSKPENSNAFAHGKFWFIQETFDFASRVMIRAVKCGKTPVFLDEIGMLEIKGQGFAPLLDYLLKSNCDLYLGVRTGNIPALVDKFRITEHAVFTGKEGSVQSRRETGSYKNPHRFL